MRTQWTNTKHVVSRSCQAYIYMYICTIITYARCMRTKVTSPPSHPSSGFFSPPPVASLRTHPNQAVVEVVRYESPAGWQFSQQIMEMLNPKIPKTMHLSGPCFFLLSSCHPAAAPLGYPSRLQALGWHRSSQRALCQSAICRMKALRMRDLPGGGKKTLLSGAVKRCVFLGTS